MTEADWLAATDPTPMIDFLRGSASDRKRRLFAVACCRSIWLLLTGRESRRAVELAERSADDSIPLTLLHKARDDARIAKRRLMLTSSNSHFRAAGAAQDCVRDTARSAFHNAWLETARASDSRNQNECDLVKMGKQAGMLRCIFGNPFRPVAADPVWLTSAVVGLAGAIYADRAFDRLPVLADALEEAGCDNADVLAHCRGDGPHARGCWVVDLLLGKS